MPDAQDWIGRFAARLGLEPPHAAAVEVLLGMAGIAAHASERTAAPISAWLVGRAGMAPTEALALAKALAAELAAEPASGGPAGDVGDPPPPRPRAAPPEG